MTIKMLARQAEVNNETYVFNPGLFLQAYNGELNFYYVCKWRKSAVNDNEIMIITYNQAMGSHGEGSLESKDIFSDRLPADLKKCFSSVSVETLNSNLSRIAKNISQGLESISSEIKEYQLDEVDVKLEVSANGQIGLVGTVGVESTGGITLKFKHVRDKNE